MDSQDQIDKFVLKALNLKLLFRCKYLSIFLIVVYDRTVRYGCHIFSNAVLPASIVLVCIFQGFQI